MLSNVKGWEKFSGHPIFIIFIRGNWICAMTNFMLSQTLIHYWQEIFFLTLTWAKSNNRKRGKLECDVTWFCFYFDFVRSHARYHVEKGSGVCLKLDPQGQGGGRISDKCATLFLYVDIMRSRDCPAMAVCTNWKVIEWI